MPIVLATAIILLLIQARGAEYPPCLPSAEAAEALEQFQRLRNPRADGVEAMAGQLRILRAALSRRPDDFHLQRRFLLTVGTRIAGISHQEQITLYTQRLGEQPNDPVRRFLQAQSLVGNRSAEALRLFERLAEDDPGFPWPQLSLAELHSFPAFQDNAKMQARALSFLKLCPDSLEAYDLLYRTTGPALAEPAAKLRALLTGRTDAAAVRVWPRLWNLEFKVRPASEHDALRRQISSDIAVLRPAAESEYSLMDTLLQGARLAGDAALLKEFQARQGALIPVRFKVRDSYNDWQQKNPYPKPDSPAIELQTYRRNKVAMLDALLGGDPFHFWFLWERASLLAEDDAVSAQVLRDAGQKVLDAATPWEETWVTTPPALLVAGLWARRGGNTPPLSALAEKGLAHQERIERNDQGTDLLDAKLIANERKEIALRNRMNAYDIAAAVYVRLGAFERARRALYVMADVLKIYRDDLASYGDTPMDPADRYRRGLQPALQHWQSRFFLHNAELAKGETRKLDALAFYASALQGPNRSSAGNGANKVLLDASALWKELGGTPEGWQRWLDQATPPRPADPGKIEVAKVRVWAKADRPFPAFRLSDVDGRERTLDDLKGEVTFVNVWATWCEPCRVELPAVQKLHERLRESGAGRVITLNTDVNTGLVRPFVAEHKYGFPVWLAQPVFDALKPMGGIPVNWIVDRDGVIRWENTGFSSGKDDEWIGEMLKKIREVR